MNGPLNVKVKGCHEISIAVNSNRFIFRSATICCWDVTSALQM
jgi:hypothetical protein